MRTKAELDAMSHQGLKDYEQSLLALWTPRMAIESDIERLSTHHSELLEVFNQLKNPDAPKNSRLKDSILSLKYKIESLEGKLSDLIQENRLNSAD